MAKANSSFPKNRFQQEWHHPPNNAKWCEWFASGQQLTPKWPCFLPFPFLAFAPLSYIQSPTLFAPPHGLKIRFSFEGPSPHFVGGAGKRNNFFFPHIEDRPPRIPCVLGPNLKWPTAGKVWPKNIGRKEMSFGPERQENLGAGDLGCPFISIPSIQFTVPMPNQFTADLFGWDGHKMQIVHSRRPFLELPPKNGGGGGNLFRPEVPVIYRNSVQQVVFACHSIQCKLARLFR